MTQINGYIRGIDVQYAPLTRTQAFVVTSAGQETQVTATDQQHQLYLELASLTSTQLQVEYEEADGLYNVQSVIFLVDGIPLTDVQMRFYLVQLIASAKQGKLYIYPDGAHIWDATRVQVMDEQVTPAHMSASMRMAPRAGVASGYGDVANINLADYIKGVDVSHHNGNIDWQGLANAGVEFLYIKVSDGYITPGTGHLYADPMAKQNAKGAHDNGYTFGYYHFARPRLSNTDDTIETDAKAQASFFLNLVSGLPANSLPDALDLEFEDTILNKDQYLEWVNAFIGTIISDPGNFNFVIYTRKEYFERKLPATHNLGNYKLWLSRYSDDYKDAITIKGWNDWQTWQFSETSVLGANRIDLNLMRK